MARNDYNSNYLAHHGILGQKWGQRNGPPYPLDAESKSAAEKKASGEVIKKKAKTAKNILKSDIGSRGSKALREAKKRDIDEISTEELKQINRRLEEERKYQQFTKGYSNEGRIFVENTAKTIATAIITGIAIEAGKSFVKSKLGI